jgi:hypothetical protein
MEASMDERLEEAIATLDDLIRLARARGLTQSELFLDMAKLQLRLELNGVTDAEFSAFCDAADNGADDVPLRRAGYARPRRAGDLRVMQRAWRRPQEAAGLRGTRRRAEQ